jgi:hypothetical protein
MFMGVFWALKVMARTHGTVVSGQEQDHGGDVMRQQVARQAVHARHLLAILVAHPQVHLALRHHPSGRDGIDADLVFAQVARQCPRQSDDGGLGGHIDRIAPALHAPGNGAEVDDGAATVTLHARHNGLTGKEHGPLIDRDTAVPLALRHVFKIVAMVVGGVVDEDIKVAQARAQFLHGRLQGCDVGDVAVAKQRCRVTGCRDALAQRNAGIALNVDESNVRPLFSKSADDRLANAASAARDKNPPSPKGGVACRFVHAVSWYR